MMIIKTIFSPLFPICLLVLFLILFPGICWSQEGNSFRHTVIEPASTGVDTTLIEKQILTDGSIIWGSQAEYHLINGCVKFVQGTALVQIADHGRKSLTVQNEDLIISANGSCFHIEAEKKVRIVVLRGTVLLEIKDQNMTVLAGETAKFHRRKQTLSKEKTNESIIDLVTAGTDYNMPFKDVTLPKLCAKISGKFNVKIYIRGQLPEKKITTDLTGLTLVECLDKLAELFGMTYAKVEDQIMIYF